jgi:hypothetical protein
MFACLACPRMLPAIQQNLTAVFCWSTFFSGQKYGGRHCFVAEICFLLTNFCSKILFGRPYNVLEGVKNNIICKFIFWVNFKKRNSKGLLKHILLIKVYIILELKKSRETRSNLNMLNAIT